MVFQYEWDDCNLHYLINQNSYNNKITWYTYRKALCFAYKCLLVMWQTNA